MQISFPKSSMPMGCVIPGHMVVAQFRGEQRIAGSFTSLCAFLLEFISQACKVKFLHIKR